MEPDSEVERYLDTLCERQRLEVFGELTGGVAHELNNALSVVWGHEELLLESLEDPQQAADTDRLLLAARTLHNWTGSALATARRLHQLSKRLRQGCGRFDLNELVKEAVELCRYRCEREQLVVVTDLHDGPTAVDLRPGELQQLIINLIHNAREALGRDGEGGLIRIATAAEDGVLSVTVEDDGPGVATGEEERIFEPGVSVKAGEGVGLGLAVARRIAERSDARLQAMAGAEGGCFVLELPPAP